VKFFLPNTNKEGFIMGIEHRQTLSAMKKVDDLKGAYLIVTGVALVLHGH
jgi:hypothetical protein